jgi:putative FmdB family regulatory protein
VPTYEYACTECGERLEVVQRFSDEPLTVCTSCSGRLRKVFSPVGIVFKGSGFYRTDSRSGSVPSSSNGKSGADGASAGGSSAGSDGGASAGAGKSDGSGSGGGASAGASDGAAKSSGNESGSGASKSGSAGSAGANSKVA